tara:strand:+ start:214 stop:366 length:153 start_codon:yes stop_codon:yes gene_type:complete
MKFQTKQLEDLSALYRIGGNALILRVIVESTGLRSHADAMIFIFLIVDVP